MPKTLGTGILEGETFARRRGVRWSGAVDRDSSRSGPVQEFQRGNVREEKQKFRPFFFFFYFFLFFQKVGISGKDKVCFFPNSAAALATGKAYNISAGRSQDILEFNGFDKDEPGGRNSEVKNCRKKLVLTMKFNNVGKVITKRRRRKKKKKKKNYKSTPPRISSFIFPSRSRRPGLKKNS